LGQPNLAAEPKAASLADLTECLRLQGARPLKLVAEAVRPALHESAWRDPRWTFACDGDTIKDRKLLPFAEDSFQFSIANETSRQDFHFHETVAEIFVSTFPLELTYRKNKREKTLMVPSGVLIVPPGIAHRVTLHGLTFVFQVATQGGQVHNDKVIES
jgi:hypothetical protein